MSFFSKVTGAFKKIGHTVGNVANGVLKFAQSPFGKVLTSIGLTALTGGMGGIFTSAMGMLRGAGTSLLGTFSGLASRFLGAVPSLLSRTGLSTVWNFLKNMRHPSQLLAMAKALFAARQQHPATDTHTDAIIKENLRKIFAKRQAEMLRAA